MNGYWILLTLLMFGCQASTEDSLGKYENKTDVELYNQAKLLQKNGNSKESSEAFSALRAFHPESTLVKKSLVDSLKQFMLSGEYEEAKQIADKILDWYPGSNIVDEAYYFKGMAILSMHKTWLQKQLHVNNYDLSRERLVEAQDCFRTLLEKFPNSRFIPQAKIQLKKINYDLAKHQIHIARYYLSQGNRSAALARASLALSIDSRVLNEVNDIKSGRGAVW